MLETILSPKTAERKPWDVFLISFIYTFIAVFFAIRIFPSQASILSLMLITLLFVPLFQRIFAIEEKLDLTKKENILTRHKNAIFVYASFFCGIVISMTMVYVFFPNLNVFDVQISTLRTLLTGSITNTNNFWLYFLNNSQTMILSFIMSVMFGTGAVFILSWNASIIAVYLGMYANSFLSSGTHPAYAYILGISKGASSILLHGVPEITAYFIAGLAGGILSIAMIREEFGTDAFKKVVVDAFLFLILSEALIFIAAMLEAFF